ncbi:hypothetical protein KYK30_32075 [Shinella yambaruensis]|uniref:Uncharacterized protein n=1 Tax=Shinella yambaruensis TaxID=415996 RepID=A0ABQ5ZUH2_9HYPH|nr:hypothetical protein [Shinella yambaruensis]MCJ8030060.1 hypothetical protein [Shinella yambaruensis]MCU7984365.1 hypothetical protein [Shinella yambaruensis]GLR54339.1 hypothetical protein GCM10007923_55560 [Shinella yambaruensis]
MRNILKIARTAPAQDDPLRVELRRAIDAHAQAKAERDRIAAAHERAERRTWDLNHEIDQATENVSELIDSRAQRSAQRAIDGTDLLDTDLKAAQQRLADAEEIMSAAQQARLSLETSVENAERVLESAVTRVENAASALMVTRAAEIEARVRDALEKLGPDLAVLVFLNSRDTSWPPSEAKRRRERLLDNPLEVIPGAGKSINSPEVAHIIAPWKQAFNALTADADAPLPEV